MPPIMLGIRVGLIGLAAITAIFATWARDQSLGWPMEDAFERATPLGFGMYVTPNSDENPIDPPERFTGYHVATDFEITPNEADKEIPVHTICSGPVVYSGYAEGYGGVLIQRCVLHGEQISVIYGHLLLNPLPIEEVFLVRGTRISALAPARSYESGGNRKHLHLGIHRGTDLDFRGYVQSEEEISQFLDPLSVLPVFPRTVQSD